MNITFLAEADEEERLTAKEDENQAVQWFTFDEALKASKETWFVENVYSKLVNRISKDLT